MRTLATRRFGRMTLALGAVLALLSVVAAPFRFADAQADQITGDYSVTIARTDVPTDVANGSTIIGHWRVTFQADGTYVGERLDLGVLVNGTYELNDDTLSVVDTNGLLSCANPANAAGGRADAASATYGYEVTSRGLTLTPKDEPCPLRRTIFSTRAFTFYVACLTVANGDATPTPRGADLPTGPRNEAATPVADDRVATATAQPSDSVTGSILDEIARAAASPAGVPSGDAPPAQNDELTAQIDTLLKQLTACWSTGDPARFLPLLSTDFQSQFLSGTEQENLDALNALKAAMQVPFVWERAGDVEETGVDRAEAVVRATAADQEEFARYLFVREDNDAWHWDGTAA